MTKQIMQDIKENAMKSLMLTVAAVIALLPLGAAEQVKNLYPVTVGVECSSPEEAQKAQLKFLPYPPGKKVAFSCRWDDSNKNNARMKKLMAKYGYKGTFYLVNISSEYRENILPELLADGCTIGNHTLHHFHLPLMTPNSVNNEILGARILHESISNQAENAFVFPFGKIAWPFLTDSEQIIASCMRRAGVLGGPDRGSFQLNKLPGNEFYSPEGKLVCPGDRDTKTEKFDADVKRFLPKEGQTAHLTLGIHVWHSDKDFQTLEQSLKKYANRPDWWYCNENEFLAAAKMFRHARVSGKKVEGKKVFFTVELPYPEDLGSETPLWAECAGKAVEIRHTRKVPQVIDAVTGEGKSAGFPGVKAQITLEKGTVLRLKIANTGAALEDVRLTLRLPPVFRQETLFVREARIKGEYAREWRLELNPAIDEAGPCLTAAQIDFTRQGVPGRLWVSLLQEKAHPAGAVLPAVYSRKEFSESELALLSRPETKLDPKVFVPLKHDTRLRSCVYKMPRGVKQPITVIVDFPGNGKMTLKASNMRKGISGPFYINGRKGAFKNGNAKTDGVSGPCRVVINMQSNLVFQVVSGK